MKIQIGKIPITISLEPDVQIGHVYKSKGGTGKNQVAFFAVFSIVGAVAHVVGIDREGMIVSTGSYTVQSLGRREVIAKIPELAALKVNMVWEPV